MLFVSYHCVRVCILDKECVPEESFQTIGKELASSVSSSLGFPDYPIILNMALIEKFFDQLQACLVLTYHLVSCSISTCNSLTGS